MQVENGMLQKGNSSSDEEIPALKDIGPKMQLRFNIHNNFKFKP